MGTRGPMPSKDPKRRNKESQPNKVAARTVADPPKLPDRRTITTSDGTVEIDWLPGTLQAWDLVWSHPLAAQYQPNTWAALQRWAAIYDDALRGCLKAAAAALTLEKEFGLTWAAQQRARLTFTEEPEPVKSETERRERIKIVDPALVGE